MPEPVDSSPDPIEGQDPTASAAEESVEGELVTGEREQLVEVRRLPVTADGAPGKLERRRVTLPAAAAAATGGFVIGVAAFLVLRVLRRPATANRLARRGARLLGRQKGLEVQASRSFLVDVHMLKR